MGGRQQVDGDTCRRLRKIAYYLILIVLQTLPSNVIMIESGEIQRLFHRLIYTPPVSLYVVRVLSNSYEYGLRKRFLGTTTKCYNI